jgi:hypothetical protein
MQMSTRGKVSCQYTKKYCIWIQKNQVLLPGYSVSIFFFSAIFFYVDSCESYATLDTPKGEKSGGVYHYSTVILIPKIQSVK